MNKAVTTLIPHEAGPEEGNVGRTFQNELQVWAVGIAIAFFTRDKRTDIWQSSCEKVAPENLGQGNIQACSQFLCFED